MVQDGTIVTMADQ